MKTRHQIECIRHIREARERADRARARGVPEKIVMRNWRQDVAGSWEAARWTSDPEVRRHNGWK